MADRIPWSDPDGTRTPSERDVNVLAAYKSFKPPVGNSHDVVFAAVRHGYDVARAADAEEIARLREALSIMEEAMEQTEAKVTALAQQIAAVRAVTRHTDVFTFVFAADLDAALASASPVTPKHEACGFMGDGQLRLALYCDNTEHIVCTGCNAEPSPVTPESEKSE